LMVGIADALNLRLAFGRYLVEGQDERLHLCLCLRIFEQRN
jgi:hypothetical protein